MVRSIISLVILSCFSTNLLANKIEKFQLSGKSGFQSAPEIVVYSSDGEKWDKIEKNHMTSGKFNLKAKCKWEGKGNKAYKLKLDFAHFKIDGKISPANHLLPHSSEVSAKLFPGEKSNSLKAKATKACNDELNKKLSQSTGKNKYDFLGKGFKVKVPHFTQADYTFKCNAIAGGKSKLKKGTVNLNSTLVCKSNPKAKQKAKAKKVKVAKIVDISIVDNFSITTKQKNYKGKCPASIKFDASVTTKFTGDLKYFFEYENGKRTAVKTIKIKKAGKNKLSSWTRTIKPNKTNNTTSLKLNNTPDFKGSLKLVIQDGKKVHSKKQTFNVSCQTGNSTKQVKGRG